MANEFKIKTGLILGPTASTQPVVSVKNTSTSIVSDASSILVTGKAIYDYLNPAFITFPTFNSSIGYLTTRLNTTDTSLYGIKPWVISRGENLLTNGTAFLRNNYNFSAFTFDGARAYGSSGSFTHAPLGSYVETDEYMPVNPDLRYLLSFFAESSLNTGNYYTYIACYDVDGLSISATQHMYIANTLTTLSQTLNNGDTSVNLTSAANWINSAPGEPHKRAFIFWNYTNSFGYKYPPLTYSRNYYYDFWADGAVDYVNNRVLLRTPWAGGTIASGTQLSNGSAGGTYKYIGLIGQTIPTTWTAYTAYMNGTDYTGTNDCSKFSPGTATVKLGWLLDYNSAGDTAWWANLSWAVDITAAANLAKMLTVDGAGSLLDADLLDGLHASSFALNGSLGNYVLKTGDTMTGTLTVPHLIDSSLTAGRVVYVGAGGELIDSSEFIFNPSGGNIGLIHQNNTTRFARVWASATQGGIRTQHSTNNYNSFISSVTGTNAVMAYNDGGTLNGTVAFSAGSTKTYTTLKRSDIGTDFQFDTLIGNDYIPTMMLTDNNYPNYSALVWKYEPGIGSYFGDSSTSAIDVGYGVNTYIYAGGNLGITVKTDGNVGIRNANPLYNLDVSGTSNFNKTINSTLPTGTAPFTLASSTNVTNLNADLLDGFHASSFALNASMNFIYPLVVKHESSIGSLTSRLTIVEASAAWLTTNTWKTSTALLREASLGTDFYWSAGLLEVSSGVGSSLWDVSTDTTTVYLHDPSDNVQLTYIEVDGDNGPMLFANMPCTSTLVGTEQSYDMQIDGSSALKVYGISGGGSILSETGVVVTANYLALGDPMSNGSFRFLVDASGILNVQKRVGGVWVVKGSFS